MPGGVVRGRAARLSGRADGRVRNDVRRPKVVAWMAPIAFLATVAVPGPVGSWVPSPNRTPSADLFASVEMVADVRGPVTTTMPLDPGARSDGALGHDSTMIEPDTADELAQARSSAAQRQAHPVTVVRDRWHLDSNVSWYGPGFYGKRTACGVAMTTTLIGVAHRSLPCGTKITFKNPVNGRTVTATVIDRGPYVSGRQWDLTGGLCQKLGHCYTGALYWRYA